MTLSGELEVLRTRVQDLEQQSERKIATSLEQDVARFGSSIEPGNVPEHGAGIDTEQGRRLIAEEAYLIAEQCGFHGGGGTRYRTGPGQRNWSMTG